MFTIEKVNASNKQRVIDFLRLDVIRHVFAFYDIQYEPEHTTMYAAFENEKLKGYILVYTAMEFPSVVLECDSDLAAKLVGYAPENRYIMHISPNLLPIVKDRLPDAKHYVEDWMIVKKCGGSFFKSELVRKLRTKDDASKLVRLRSTEEDAPRRTMDKQLNWISRMPVYGVFIGDELVSFAGSFIQLPQVWMIGGVYTHPNHRNRGYATLATSAVTEEALKHAETAALFVRSDNYPAIKVYEKIGYEKLGEKLWIDVGTGMKP
jgi:RimJ/RimL family protein N-acetyltransferase